MTVELIKQMMDACYLAKRARDLLPALPEGVQPSYIRFLDTLQKLEARGGEVRVSDLSDALGLPRPGVTRTVKEMEAKGYLRKQVSARDGRVTYLSRKYDADFFRELAPRMECIAEEDAKCMIATIETFYKIMSERRDSFET